MATITDVTEFHDDELGGETWSKYEGWRVTTEDDTITVGISNQASCCESWGYFSTDDDPKRFIGADLQKVERVMDGVVPKSIAEYGLDGGGAMFVNFVTDRGTFQLAVYNNQTGYYGHSAVVVSRDLNVSEML